MDMTLEELDKMPVALISIKIKLPETISDKEFAEIVKKYIDVNPPTRIRAVKYSDVWGVWL